MQKTLFSFFASQGEGSPSSQKSQKKDGEHSQDGAAISQPSPSKQPLLYSTKMKSSTPLASPVKSIANPPLFSTKSSTPNESSSDPILLSTKSTLLPSNTQTNASPLLPIARYAAAETNATNSSRKSLFQVNGNAANEQDLSNDQDPDDLPLSILSQMANQGHKTKEAESSSIPSSSPMKVDTIPTLTRSGRICKPMSVDFEDDENEQDKSPERKGKGTPKRTPKKRKTEDDDYYAPENDDDEENGDPAEDELVPEEDEAFDHDALDDDEDDSIMSHVKKQKKSNPSRTNSAPSTPAKSFGLPKSVGFSPHEQKKDNPYRSSNHDDARFDWLENIRDAKGVKKGDPGYDPTTLFIPPIALQKLTAFEKQYWDIKRKHFDTVVFFKKGKFYELYENDADLGNQLLGLKMTDRVNMRMAGVPEASFNVWASQLLQAGYKVAKVDEMESNLSMQKRKKENPKDGKFGNVKSVMQRELTSILTAGTVSDPDLIQSRDPSYLLAIKEFEGINKIGICLVDVSTSTFYLAQFEDDVRRTQVETLCLQMKPKEILVEKKNLGNVTSRVIRLSAPSAALTMLEPEKEFWDSRTTVDYLSRPTMYGSDTPQGSKWPSILRKMVGQDLAISSLGAIIHYLLSVKSDPTILLLNRITEYSATTSSSTLILDGQTLLNLEILENTYDGGSEGTLLQLLDYTSTAFGRRLFRSWVCHPLRFPGMIDARLDAVEQLMTLDELKDVCALLKKLPDLERLLSRIQTKSCRVAEFLSVIDGFSKIQSLYELLTRSLAESKSEILQKFTSPAGPFRDLKSCLKYYEKAFDQTMAREQGFLSPSEGADPDYDKVVAEVKSWHTKLDNHLEDQKKALKISSLVYKNVGKELYQIEIAAKSVDGVKLPQNYVLMSQTKTVKRYWTPFIQTCFGPLKEAEEKQSELRETFLARLQERFDQNRKIWRGIVDAVSELDALISLARASLAFGAPSCRPKILEDEQPVLQLKSMRHPFAKTTGDSSTFIPNDTILGGQKEPKGEHARVILLTGPNMGGKSTLLRQTSLAVILAQLGCYVPAEECTITPVDRIFTRLGARDNIMAGQSTFMVELQETSNILKYATKNSLVVLDELGRGTSTFDGFSIAYAVLQHISSQIGCRCLFSTHYHMLTDEFLNHPVVALKHMACHVDEQSQRVTFLYHLSDGICPKSYGMNVAAMAGIPKNIVDRADAIAANFEEATLESIQKRREFCQIDLDAKSNYQFITAAASGSDTKKAFESIVTAWYSMFTPSTEDNEFI